MLVQNQRKISGHVRTHVTSSCQLLFLRALVRCMGFCPLPPRQDKEATISSFRDPILIVISWPYVAHPSLPPSQHLELSHIPLVFPEHHISISFEN
jgi:hypothetical protein